MLDDEVEYLGSRPAPMSDPMTHQPIVTGITIHVEKSGSAPAYDLVFHKADSRVIQIGRRPGTDIDKYDPDKAMFRCPVVSRKHAKITFTDVGSVYLFDLQSHHGTHIRKPDETISTPLLPESPYLLAGGEIVTLGKSVGKGEDLVRPVVFRIEIQYSQSNASAQLIDLTRSASSERQVSPPITIALKSSGRYGLNDSASSASSSSSDEMSCSYTSENTSDIEEISSTSSHEKGKCASGPNSSHIGHAIEVLKNLIPPLHPSSLPSQRSQSSGGEHSPLLVFPHMHLPTLNSYCHRHRRFPTSPPFDLPPLSVALFEKTPENFDWDKSYRRDVGGSRSDKSRSTSPMDLGSPSPAPVSEKQTSLPLIDWQLPLASPVPSISSLYVECGLDPTTPALSCVAEERSAPAEQEAEPISIPTPRSLNHLTEEDQAKDTQTKIDNAMEAELGDLSVSIEDMKVEMMKLQSSQQDIESLVNTDVCAISERLTGFEEHMTNLNLGLNKVEGSCNANASDIQEVKSHLSKMESDLASLRDAAKSAPEANKQDDQLNEKQDVIEGIETLRQLISEMKDLRDNTRQQMTAELDLVKVARNAALNDIQRLSPMPAENQSPATPKSLKRKRDDGDEESQEATEEQRKSSGEKQPDVEMKVVDEESERCETPTTAKAQIVNDSAVHRTAEANVDEVVPPRKRARRARKVTTAFQTATAIALGAVATWTALAYT